MDNFVITIGRFCGSGGSLVAAKLGKKLGIEVYDRKILSLASSNSGINEQAFELADEDLKNSLLYRVSRSAFDGAPIMPESASNTANKNLYNYQAKVIKGLADVTSCIIIGRCADYVLRDRYNVLRVFVAAGKESCIENESRRSHLTLSEARRKVEEVDRRRGDYYRFYTGQQWGDPRQFDLCLNTDVFTHDQCIELILQALKIKTEDHK